MARGLDKATSELVPPGEDEVLLSSLSLSDMIRSKSIEPEAALKSVPSAVKAGFTRKYNSSNQCVSVFGGIGVCCELTFFPVLLRRMVSPIAFHKATELAAKTKVGAAGVPDLEDAVEEEVVPDDDEEEDKGDDDDVSKDKLVKKPKAAAAAKGKAKAKPKK